MPPTTVDTRREATIANNNKWILCMSAASENTQMVVCFELSDRSCICQDASVNLGQENPSNMSVETAVSFFESSNLLPTHQTERGRVREMEREEGR